MLRLYTGVTTWWADLKGRAAEEGGATAVEYALMVALIAVVIIAAVTLIGENSSEVASVSRCSPLMKRGWVAPSRFGALATASSNEELSSSLSADIVA